MTTIPLIGKSGKSSGQTEIPAAFARRPDMALLHAAVVRELANRRAGSADTKTRAEVAGGGRKPWRQKGTGRARAGSIRSPIWRTGGVVFGPHPRSYALDMNRKARRAALAMAIAAKADAGQLSVVDPAAIEIEKSKELRSFLWARDDAGDRVLLIVHRERDGDSAAKLARAGRNLARLRVVGHGEAGVRELLAADRVLVSKNALDALAEVCGG